MFLCYFIHINNDWYIFLGISRNSLLTISIACSVFSPAFWCLVISSLLTMHVSYGFFTVTPYRTADMLLRSEILQQYYTARRTGLHSMSSLGLKQVASDGIYIKVFTHTFTFSRNTRMFYSFSPVPTAACMSLSSGAINEDIILYTDICFRNDFLCFQVLMAINVFYETS